MRLNPWARRADPAEEALVAQVAGLVSTMEIHASDLKRLAERVSVHDGIHANPLKHLMENVSENSSKAAADLARFMLLKARAQIIDKVFKSLITAVLTAIIFKLGLESLKIGGIALGSLLQ